VSDHIGQQLLDALEAALGGIVVAPHVFQQRTTPTDDSKLPCLLVCNGDETSEFGAMGTDTGRPLDRMPRLVVIGCVRIAAASPYRALNAIRAEVEAKVAAHATLGGLADNIELIETNFDVPTEAADKRAGRVALTFQCETRTPAGDATTKI
jgi:hypothetical protein